MQTSSFFNPLTPPGACFSGDTLRQSKMASVNRHSRLRTTVFKKDGPNNYGKTVDENMIVLRERIRKLKAEMEMEFSCGDQLPENWMEWEKTYTYSGGYHSDVYEGIALLQRFLMEARPSVAIGLVAGLAFCSSTVAMELLWWLVNSLQGN